MQRVKDLALDALDRMREDLVKQPEDLARFERDVEFEDGDRTLRIKIEVKLK